MTGTSKTLLGKRLGFGLSEHLILRREILCAHDEIFSK
jgi:hypothetical protein